jgi:hypothetical protein
VEEYVPGPVSLRGFLLSAGNRPARGGRKEGWDFMGTMKEQICDAALKLSASGEGATTAKITAMTSLKPTTISPYLSKIARKGGLRKVGRAYFVADGYDVQALVQCYRDVDREYRIRNETRKAAAKATEPEAVSE